MSNIYENMMKQYEDSHSKSNSNAKKYDLKNYFTTYLPEGVTSDTKQIRLLPPKEGQLTPFTVKWGHKKQVDGAWKTYACLKHENDEACPFCEAREVLLAEGTDADKELAKKYSARKMYVAKVIDRNKEGEGVKFWRFNHDYRKQGTMDLIAGAIGGAGHDISDPDTGRDLTINLGRNQNNVPVVQSVSYPLQSTPLNADAEVQKSWLDDDRTWRDVYSVRDYAYLTIIVKGDIPVWSKEKECFVGKSTLEAATEGKQTASLDKELTLGITNAETTQTVTQPVTETATATATVTQPVTETTTATAPVTTPASVEEDDDDLPF